ncbi:MAG TPA: SAM-dependent methyltransferase [Vicinamibacterales bacterium]|nr:SAM-dependent methyltransferase [Vicinamibacterales bacterium]
MSTLNLDHQRKQARALLNAVRGGDLDALRRMADAGVAVPTEIALHHAQLVVARESGFRSWSRLRERVRSECVGRPRMLAGLLGAANSAAETARADALFRDPLACELAGEAGRAVWAATRQTTWPGYQTSGPDPVISIFTRFFDDGVRRAVADAAIAQVVIVGAAMDTRAFRLHWPAGLRLFEVDAGEVFEHKEPVLRRLEARPSCQRQTVVVTRDGSFARQLQRKGFDPAQKAAFLVQGTQFLSEAAAERTIREVSTLASAGSWLGLALVSRATLASVFMKIFLDKLESLGLPPWTFGVDDPDAWLDAQGWTTHTAVAGDPTVSYGRWPYGYIPKGTPGVPRTFLTQAWKRDITALPGAACGTAPAPR